MSYTGYKPSPIETENTKQIKFKKMCTTSKHLSFS